MTVTNINVFFISFKDVAAGLKTRRYLVHNEYTINVLPATTATYCFPLFP
jgi:hypothetical protein